MPANPVRVLEFEDYHAARDELAESHAALRRALETPVRDQRQYLLGVSAASIMRTQLILSRATAMSRRSRQLDRDAAA